MANPQKEKGYTPVANEILDMICQFTFNGAQLRIIIKVWRMTYGYGRKKHEFAVPYLEKATKLSESTIKKEIALLVREKVLLVTQKATGTTGRKLSFNKNYDEWNIPKSGDLVASEDELFEDVEVQDPVLRTNDVKVQDTILSKVQDTVLSDHSKVQDSDPIKERKILKKKIFKENVDVYEKFYFLYPRRISKAAGKKAWDTLSKKEEFDPELIIQNTLNFAETCKLLETEIRYIPHPSTYLNQKRYEEYPVIDPEGLASSKKKVNAFEKNKELLLGGRGEDLNDRGTGEVHSLQSFSSLPSHRDI